MRKVRKPHKLTPEHCRAARGLLGWSQGDLERCAGVSRKTLADFEGGKRTPYDRTLADIRGALEAGGVIFIDGDEPGVQLRRHK